MTQTDRPPATVEPYRLFLAEVRALRRMSPTFLRVTVTGQDLADFADNGYDQRIKLLVPVPGRGLADLPTGPGWYQDWRRLAHDRRPPMRTFTVRAVRQAAREVDLDVVVHPPGDGDGPGARWARAVRPGDRLAVVGPDARYPGRHGGVDFQPPARTGAVLLAGDETAVPAIAAILERLPAATGGEALLEVPQAAGEAGMIRRLRRLLLVDHGLDRRAVALMGYWRLGRAEDNG